jgi:O-antigen ligase
MALPTISKRKGLRWCYLASVFFLLQTSEAFAIVDRLVYGEWANKPGDKITAGLNLLMIATSVLLFWRAWRTKRIGTSEILALALASFLLLSAVWSIDPQTTVRRGVVYLFIIMGTIGVVGSLEGDEVMSLVGITCGLCAAASIVLLVISPSVVIGPLPSSDFRGIFSQKNGLGQVMAVGALASLSGIRISRGRKRLFKILTLILFIIIAFASKSGSALVMIFFFCTMGGAIALFGIAGILSVISIILLVVVSLDTDTALGLIGKDSTLTGRTELWSYLIYYIQQRPILGWGYSAFWSGNNPAAIEISTALRWDVPQAHNAAIGILLEVGIVGLAFFLFLWVRNVALSLKCMSTSAKELAASSLLCCGGVLLCGIAEPVLLESGSLLTVFFMTGVTCERAVRAGRRQRYPNYAAGSPAGFPTNALETNFGTRRAIHVGASPTLRSRAR